MWDVQRKNRDVWMSRQELCGELDSWSPFLVGNTDEFTFFLSWF